MAESSPSAKEGVEMDSKGHHGKRKPSLFSEASVTGLEMPKDESSPKTPKLVKQAKELAETLLKPKPKFSVNPKRKKAVLSAKRAPRTSKQTVGKRELLQSV